MESDDDDDDEEGEDDEQDYRQPCTPDTFGSSLMSRTWSGATSNVESNSGIATPPSSTRSTMRHPQRESQNMSVLPLGSNVSRVSDIYSQPTLHGNDYSLFCVQQHNQQQYRQQHVIHAHEQHDALQLQPRQHMVTNTPVGQPEYFVCSPQSMGRSLSELGTPSTMGSFASHVKTNHYLPAWQPSSSIVQASRRLQAAVSSPSALNFFEVSSPTQQLYYLRSEGRADLNVSGLLPSSPEQGRIITPSVHRRLHEDCDNASQID
ncbi:hypothetical protein PYCC9005_001793 [Savitreella phatthalungensis]